MRSYIRRVVDFPRRMYYGDRHNDPHELLMGVYERQPISNKEFKEQLRKLFPQPELLISCIVCQSMAINYVNLIFGGVSPEEMVKAVMEQDPEMFISLTFRSVA